ncbi:MAG: rane protein of unknown function [Phycisphaerales bacterium]|nr:rane protein of unknown function [Phycisphaerales bacterium]
MAASTTTERLRWNTAPRHFFAHLATMPRWHKLVLLLGLGLAIAGGIGWMTSRAASDSGTRVTSTSTSVQAPAGSSKFIDGGASPSDTTVTTTTREEPPTLIGRLSPNATRIGGSVVAGFVFGWIFRAFLKTVTFFALLAGAALMALSYFGVINVDFSSAREHYASALHWLTDQSARLKDVLLAHLPSSGGGALGAFLGFRRR